MVRSSARAPRAELTLDAWAALPEDQPGELVDGRLEREEVPTRVHEAVVAWLMFELTRWARERGARVYGSELKLVVGPRRGRKADVSVFLRGSPRSPAHSALQHHLPDVVIEVVSSRPSDARRDRVAKRDDYARAGVRFYWIVDPELRAIEVLERGAEGRYLRVCAASAGSVRAPGLEGLALDLDALWREVDRELEADAET